MVTETEHDWDCVLGWMSLRTGRTCIYAPRFTGGMDRPTGVAISEIACAGGCRVSTSGIFLRFVKAGLLRRLAPTRLWSTQIRLVGARQFAVIAKSTRVG